MHNKNAKAETNPEEHVAICIDMKANTNDMQHR
jgi:hypothetical protein